MPQAKKIFLKPAIVFLMVSLVCFIADDKLRSWQIDPLVVMGANLLLLNMTIVVLVLLMNAMKNTNPNVFTRTVMAGTFIKLMVLAAAAVIYLFAAGENRSVYGIIASLLLYVIYTIVETKTILQLNQKQDAKR